VAVSRAGIAGPMPLAEAQELRAALDTLRPLAALPPPRAREEALR
jgi:hypothetical protein